LNDIFLKVHQSLRDNAIFAIQEDYHAFLESAQSPSSGKLFLIDRSDYNTLEIFFDISTDYVDTRDIVDGKHISSSEAEGKYVIPVDKIEVLKDQDFFIKAIERCETALTERIKSIEEGVDAVKEGSELRDEWKELQESKDSEYLRRTVYPLLYPALQILERERPNDPLSFIALYLLKNKHLVTLPKPPAPQPAQPQPTHVEGSLAPNQAQTTSQPPAPAPNTTAAGAPPSSTAKPAAVKK